MQRFTDPTGEVFELSSTREIAPKVDVVLDVEENESMGVHGRRHVQELSRHLVHESPSTVKAKVSNRGR